MGEDNDSAAKPSLRARRASKTYRGVAEAFVALVGFVLWSLRGIKQKEEDLKKQNVPKKIRQTYLCSTVFLSSVSAYVYIRICIQPGPESEMSPQQNKDNAQLKQTRVYIYV